MANQGRIPVCFDVLGTCFSFDVAVEALVKVFPDVDRARADSVIQDWFHSAQRDFTYASMNDDYKPIAQVLKATLPRIYAMHRLVSPSTSPVESARLVEPVFDSIKRMRPRPGLRSCAQTLKKRPGRESTNLEFDLIAVTNGGLETTRNYFSNAFSDGREEFEWWSFVSCDEIEVAKPDQRVYENVWKRLEKKEEEDETTRDRRRQEGQEGKGAGVRRGFEKRGWFVASHTWDLHAAKKAGFRTAFVTYEEHCVVAEIFGEPDVVANDLEEVARRIIEWEEARQKE
ncbi:hypothetical protein JCM3766R1_001164 [Sporobolomyces carnicolor]